jgi:hypothetical protein
MEPWLIQLLASPPAVVFAYIAYRLVKHVFDAPVSCASLVALFAGERRRADALKLVKVLRGGEEDEPPPITAEPPAIGATPEPDPSPDDDPRPG